MTIKIKKRSGKTMKTIAVGSKGAGVLRYYSYKAGNTQYNVAKNKLVIS